ncbi:MAG: NUDIX domain-containing protein [Pseudomonadota bacterium]
MSEATPGHRISAGVVVVRPNEADFEFLLLRAYQHWDFPKGLVEAGETSLQAAVREVEEETSISDLDFQWGEHYLDTGPYNRGKTARYYLAQTRKTDIYLPINPDLGKPEHVEFRWCEYRESMKLTSARVRPVVNWAANILKID